MTDPSAADSTPDTVDAKARAAKSVILLTVFLDILGFGIIIPQLGVYAAQFGGRPSEIGILAATYSVMQFLASPFWGRLSDRIGRRPVLLWSIFGTSVGYVIFAFAHALPFLFLARFIDGTTGGNISTAQAYLSDITSARDRAKTFGLFGAVFGIGFAVGPMIGSFISHLPGVWGTNLGIGLFTALLALVNWALAVKRLPETLSVEARAVNAERHANAGKWQIINIRGFARAFSIPGLNRLMTVAVLGMVAFATLQGTYTLYLINTFVRPQVQSSIRANPDVAAANARQVLAEAATAVTIDAGEEHSQVMRQLGGDNVPYPTAMGGDFVFEHEPPLAMTWRQVEKILVRPAAAQFASTIFMTIGLVTLVVQGFLIGPLRRRISEVNLILIGSLLMAIALALVALPKPSVGEYFVMALLAFGNGISSPVITSMVSILAPELERGEMLGVFQSTQSLGRIIGPIAGGFLFDAISPHAPYLVGGLVMFVSFVLAFGLRSVPTAQVDAPSEALATET